MKIEKIITAAEIVGCFNLMQYLRPHLNQNEFVEKIERQRQQGYEQACVLVNNIPVSLIGYRVFECTAWGKILYIDDLITAPSETGKGYAGSLLDWVDKIAIQRQCDAVHLDTGPQRHDAHRLYLNKGFTLNSYHMQKLLG